MPPTFVINDENLNNSGFWISTNGIDVKQFKKNPLMLWMHKRPWGQGKDEILPIGTWENIRKEGSQLLADPVFDQNDDFAKQIESKVESGVLRMASPGLRPVAWSDDPKTLKPGQTRASLLKCVLKEISIVDMGRNDKALKLYDEEGEQVNLSDNATFIPKLNKNENKMKLSEKSLEVLNLTENSTEAEVNAAILAKLSKVSDADVKLAEKDAEILKLKEDYDKLVKSSDDKAKKDFEAILANPDLKLTDNQKRDYLELFDASGSELATKIVNALPKHKKLSDIPVGGDSGNTQNLSDEWGKLHKEGKLEILAKENPERFAELKAAKFSK